MIDEARRARLLAAIDGELAASERAALEVELTIDLPLSEEFDALTALDRTLRHDLAPLGATDEVIAARVMELAPAVAPPERMTRPTSARSWVGVLTLAAALLLVLRLLPPPPSPADEWRLANADGQVLWIPVNAREKIPADPTTEISGPGELVTLQTEAAALIAPDGTEVFLAPRSGIALTDGAPEYTHGRLWVRSDRPWSIDLNGAVVTGTGSFVVDDERKVITVEVLRGSADVRFDDGTLLALGPRQATWLSVKGEPEPFEKLHGELDLTWAIDVLGTAATADTALGELIDAHVVALFDERMGPRAVKGIAGWIGPAAVPALTDALLAPAEGVDPSARQRLAWALRESIRGPLDDVEVVERLFSLPLEVERAIREDVLGALAGATDMPVVPDLAFWTGKTSPEERARALDRWRKKWTALRMQRESESPRD